jgi:hypothetical protein
MEDHNIQLKHLMVDVACVSDQLQKEVFDS